MKNNITTKFKGDATDLYVELAGGLYDLCQKYAELGTVDEVIHGQSVMAQNFDKVVNELENLIIVNDTPTDKQEASFRKIAQLLSTNPNSITEGNPNGFVETDKFDNVMGTLVLISNYIEKKQPDKAKSMAMEMIKYLYLSGIEYYNIAEAVKELSSIDYETGLY